MAKVNNIINKIVWWILIFVALTPLLVDKNANYPFIIAKTSLFRLLILVVFILILWEIHNNKKPITKLFNFKYNKILVALSIFTIALLISAIFGVDVYNSFWSGNERMMGIISWLFVVIFYLCLIYIFRNNSYTFPAKKLFQYLILICAFLVSITAILGYFSGFLLPSLIGARLAGASGNPAFLAIYMLFAAFLALSLALEDYKKNNNHSFVFWLLGFLYFSVILFGTGTRGAMLGWGVGSIIILIYLIAKYYKEKIGKLALSIFLIGIAFVSLIVVYRNTNFVKNSIGLSRLTSISIKDITAQTRIYSAKTAIKAWKEKPIFGWGLENYKPAFLHNFIPEMFNNNPNDVTLDKAHNMPLELLATTGLVGVIAYMYLWVVALYSCIIKIKNKETSDIAGVAIIAGLVGYFIANLFLFDVFESLFMFSIFLALCTPDYYVSSQSLVQKDQLPNRFKFSCLVIISILGIWIGIKAVILPYIDCTYFSVAKKDFLNKQYDESYLYLQKGFALDTMVTRDSSWVFIKDYVLQRDVMAAEKKAKFDQLISENIQKMMVKYPSSQDPKETYLYFIINSSESSVQDIANAKNIAIQLTQYAPNYLHYRTSLAFIYGLTKEYNKAMEEINYVLSKTDKLAQPYWYKGIILNAQGKTTEALDNFYLAVSKGYQPDSEEVSALLTLALKYGDYKYLPTIYRSAIVLDPKNTQLYASLAAAYQKIGDYDNARITAQKMLELNPSLKPQVDAFLKTLPAK